MKKVFDWRILIIILLIVILAILLKFYFDAPEIPDIYSQVTDTNLNNIQTNAAKIIQTTAEIQSGLKENIELHATYYLAECYVQENQEVKEGENILKYTNGTYLVAPYDCVVTQLNVPEENGQCTNEHYVAVSSVGTLAVQFKIDETNLNKISLGQSAKIDVSAFEEKEIEGYITKISNTAENGKFTVTVEFENDGDIKLGMSANVEI